MERRKALNYLLGTAFGGWLASVFFPVLRYLNPPGEPETGAPAIKVATIGEIPVNGVETFQFGRKPGALLYLSNGEYRAFNTTCTHLSCITQYQPEKKLFWCACHGGAFDLNGINIAGPPPRPLERFQVEIKGDEIWVLKEV
jgi:Rieske Fe-S protein